MFRIQSSFSKLNGNITAYIQADRDKLIFWKSENFCCRLHFLAVVGRRRGKGCKEEWNRNETKGFCCLFISPESPWGYQPA